MGAILLEGLLMQGVHVDVYTSERVDELANSVRNHPSLTLVRTEPRWEWGRWYSRWPFLAFLSGTWARTRAHRRLCLMLLQHHRRDPYDCVFQLSQMELFTLGKYLQELPPIVVYPCTHAAGELRWHRRESAFALQSESMLMHYVTRLVLTYRARVQRREVVKPALVIGPSNQFNQLLSADYGLNPSRQGVLRHPVILPPSDTSSDVRLDAPPAPPVRLLFVSRISVRKGLEQVIELSRRLDDLAGQVRIDVIGERTQWSDYTAHLNELNPRIATVIGEARHEEMARYYAAAHGIVIPSLYEPGSLVVGEALASGVTVVASDAVGPTEVLGNDCCRTFPAGDVDAFERKVRQFVVDACARPLELRRAARHAAFEHFAPEKVVADLLGLLREAASKPVKRIPVAVE